ncbi:hypothetical protein ACWEOE_08535 [Amycolatopsis sp. NPDC004368]
MARKSPQEKDLVHRLKRRARKGMTTPEAADARIERVRKSRRG